MLPALESVLKRILPDFIRLCRNTLQLAAGMKGKVNLFS
jgi:hypothetical protein